MPASVPQKSFGLQISATMKCMHKKFIFIVLNVRDGTESKYSSIVFLSISDHARAVITIKVKISRKCHNY